MNDLRFAFRQLLKNPGFTAVAVLTLALGLGVNVAVFSMANAVLWRPLPLPAPHQLIALGEADQQEGSRGGASAPNYADWREQCQSFSALAAVRAFPVNLSGVSRPERLVGAEISKDYFDVLRVQPEFGRFFDRSESASGHARVVIISHRLWKRQLSGSTPATGQTIRLNGENHTVIGVMPENAQMVHEEVDLWTPLNIRPEFLSSRELQPYAILARLRPGVSLEQARAEMNVLAAGLRNTHPSLYRNLEIWVSPLGERSEASRPAFLLLLAVAVAILLMACANLASLLLVRSVYRRGEICVRSAVGASRGRVIRQLLAESLILSLAGGGLGLVFAKWGSELLPVTLSSALAAQLPSFVSFQPDGTVLAFFGAVCLVAALLFGLVPSLEASKVDLSAGLKTGRDLAGGPQARRLSLIFVTTQIAICFATVLFTGAGFKSLRQAIEIQGPPSPQTLLTFELTLAGPEFTGLNQRSAFLEQLTRRISELPGVTSVSSGSSVPFAGSAFRRVTPAEPEAASGKDLVSYAAEVAPRYFETLGISVQRGRSFTPQDHRDAPPVAVISEYLARRLFGDRANPLGRRIRVQGHSREIEIVGIVPNVHQSTLGTIRSQTMNLYLSQAQFGGPRAMILVRAGREPNQLVDPIRAELAALNPDLPLFAARTMADLIVIDQRFLRYLIGCMAGFSILAVGLALIGVYGTVAYSIAQRNREFGVRMALGATPLQLLRLVVMQAMKPVMLGVGLGMLATAWLVRPLIESLFYNVSGASAWMFLSAALGLTLATAWACFMPALAACRANPMKTLRNE